MDFLVLEDNLEFLEMLVPEVNQEHLVKSLLQLALMLLQSQDHQDLPDLQVLLEPMVCLVPSARLVSQDDPELREIKEIKEIKDIREIRESKGNLASLGLSHVQKPPEPTNLPQVLACLAHQVLQGMLEQLVLQVLLVRVNRVLLDAGVLQESQELVFLDLQEIKESRAVLFLPQEPFLLDHQDPRAHQVTEDQKGSKENQVNQDFQGVQEVQGNQVMVSLDLRDLRVHQAPRGQRGSMEIKDHLDHLDYLDYLVRLEEMEVDQQMWVRTLQSTFRVAHSVQAPQGHLDHQVLLEEMELYLDHLM
ncbi:uncharacterized protein [Notothenia coriiceps]|uniref:Uncharacterized protein n=1 Tax=Notothenia coriiceps TaxID=8208 RepID=A0A6I9PNF4_9TELE|nr:PREDICTED: uncharacterized protein LOC104962041 [Notothenia coriiceps]